MATYLCVWKVGVLADTPEEAVKQAAQMADDGGAANGWWQVYPKDQAEPGYEFDLGDTGYDFEDGDAPTPKLIRNIFGEL